MENAKLRVESAQLALDNHSQAPVNNTATSDRNRRNGTRQNYTQLSGGRVNATPRNEELENALTRAKAIATERTKEYENVLNEFIKFQDEHYCTYEGFLDLGWESVRPIFEKVEGLFLSPDGDYATIVKAYTAARVLNPLVAQTMCEDSITDTVEELAAFGFVHFSPSFIAALKREIPKYMEVLKRTPSTFWDTVEGADAYDKALEKKASTNPGKPMVTFN